MVRTEFEVKIFFRMDAPFGGRFPGLFPEPLSIEECCEFIAAEIKRIMVKPSTWANSVFEYGTTYDSISTHVNITSIPPHEGDIVVDIKFYVDRPTLYEDYYNAFRLVSKFPIYRLSETFDAYNQNAYNYFTAPAGSASPPFETKDYYCVLGPV